eukprot:TRINITY_DN66137_c3_g1_i1.p1 TRINITY_DN66137_c3_g1~~TRINITY_DN66137_c3_g1_i1.p1  ORF type:complete len:272 (-),score=32.25 TRINITY_DN66137_c3_g1_i1:53-868(-)
MAARQRALEKKAVLQAERDNKALIEKEKQEAALWKEGSRDFSKQKAAELKEQEKLRKKQEVNALLKEEENTIGNGKARSGGKKKKGKDDFDLLKQALAAQPKTKAQKEKEAKEKEAELRKKKEIEAKANRDARIEAEQNQLKRIASRGIIIDHAEELMQPINNQLLDVDDDVFVHDVRNVENAISVLNFATDTPSTPVPTSKNQTALYNKFCENLLPRLKEELPGLKLSQYQERMFDAWKKSPENPQNMNTPPVHRSASRGQKSPLPNSNI